MMRAGVPEEQPTRGAQELIHRRDNLVALIEHAGLLQAEPKTKLLDRALEWVAGTPPTTSRDDAVDKLVVVLSRRLKVEAGDVTIAVEFDWPDAQQAHRVVQGAVQNFLEAKYVQEVTSLEEAVSLLRTRAYTVAAEVADARGIQAGVAARTPRQVRSAPGPAATEPAVGTRDLARLKSLLEAKERAVADVEDFRRRRVTELLAQYESRRAVLTEAHPELMNLRADIAALGRDSPQLTTLRADEQRLRAEYEALGAEVRASATPRPAQDARHVGQDAAPREATEEAQQAHLRRRDAVEALDNAQASLDTARAAFKHRYNVVWPAEVAKKPVSPSPIRIFGIGGFASLLFALAAAVVADWRSGKVSEHWQLERGLNLRVLGELRRGR